MAQDLDVDPDSKFLFQPDNLIAGPAISPLLTSEGFVVIEPISHFVEPTTGGFFLVKNDNTLIFEIGELCGCHIDDMILNEYKHMAPCIVRCHGNFILDRLLVEQMGEFGTGDGTHSSKSRFPLFAAS